MSEQQKSVKLGEIIQEFNLEILRTAPDYENVPLRALDINRPGLPLTGFFEHFDTERLLLIGLTEHTYLSDLTPEQRRERFDRLLSYPVPALILTRGLEAYPECLEMADKHDRTVLRSTQHPGLSECLKWTRRADGAALHPADRCVYELPHQQPVQPPGPPDHPVGGDAGGLRRGHPDSG